ncbi:elongator complex protein 5 [Pogona vitticeps]
MLGELVAGGAEGLVLLQDSVTCEGRTLLKSFVAASAKRGELVHVFSFDTSEEEFKAGFGTEIITRTLFHDAFRDPLGWAGEDGAVTLREFSASGLVARLVAQTPQGPLTVVLDSLSWLLLRLPFPSVCQLLAQLLRKSKAAGLKITRLVALLHGDLHQPGQLETLHALAHVVVSLKPEQETIHVGTCAPRVAVILDRRKGRKVTQKKQCFTILSGFALKDLGEPPTAGVSGEEGLEESKPAATADPTAHLTFNLHLSEAERRAKESVPLPYHFSEEKKLSLLQKPAGQAEIFYEPDAADDVDEEDPDDDLDV